MPVVSSLPVRRPLNATCRSARGAAAVVALVLVVAGVAAAPSVAGAPGGRDAAQADPLFERIWAGVQEAGNTVRNACGTITETRVSRLLARPLVCRGTFCAAGTTAFRLDYTEPEPLRIVYNEGLLNVTTQAGRHTEVIDVARAVQRTQEYFGGKHSLENVRRDFAVSAVEEGELYTVTLKPLSSRFASRITQVVAKLARATFVLRRLEIHGKNGVDSLFDVRVDRTNVELDPDTFKVYRPARRP